MAHRAKKQASRRLQPRSRSYQPAVEILEERLPPGDVVLGGMLGRSWLTPAVTGLAADPLAAPRIEILNRGGSQQLARPTLMYAAAYHGVGSNLFIASQGSHIPGGGMGNSADPTRPVAAPPNKIEPAFREASGLDQEAFDHLLADDLGEISSSKSPNGNGGPRGRSADSDTKAPPAAEPGAAVGGSTPVFSQGPQGLSSTPPLANDPNGGLYGGGGAAAAGGASGLGGPSVPNLVTGGHFAIGTLRPGNSPSAGTARSSNGDFGGSHGTITPFNLPPWPSDTLPTANGSGGCSCACSGERLPWARSSTPDRAMRTRTMAPARCRLPSSLHRRRIPQPRAAAVVR
jgi:hypothetical protein